LTKCTDAVSFGRAWGSSFSGKRDERGIVGFLITSGKSVCIVEARNWNCKKASVQNVLGMEVAVDDSNESAHGIVTN
jgi:hypothetical protein